MTPSGSHVVFDPTSAQAVEEGETIDFTVVADGGYVLSSTVTGTCPAGSWTGAIYTTGAIIADCTVAFSASSSGRKIFVTAATHNGNLGGIAGADALCTADANKPASGTYKALIVDGTAREACTTANCGGGPGEHADWVLAASTACYKTDGTTQIGTTTANGIFYFPLTNSFGDASENAWTGLDNNWTKMDRAGIDDCTDWTSSAGDDAGAIGNFFSTSNSSIQTGGAACSLSMYLICVEQ